MLRHVLAAAALVLLSTQIVCAAPFCPTTLPPTPAFVPPAPYNTASIAGFWYGTEALWIQLPVDGTWRGLPFDGKSYGQKIFWFSRDYDWHTSRQPDIVVTSRRLDADGPRFVLKTATNAILGSGMQAILTGAVLPTAGCWEITGHYRGAALTFVVSIVH